MFYKKGILKNFVKSIGEHLCLRSATLLKKRLWHRCFPVNFAKFLRKFFYRTPPNNTIPIIRTHPSCNFDALNSLRLIFFTSLHVGPGLNYYHRPLTHRTMNRLYHGTITRTGITCKKFPCYMCDSACTGFIVKKAKIF